MAEGLLKHICQNEFEIHSAGTHPSIVRPEAVRVLREIGIDISGNHSKAVEEFEKEKIEYVLTVCDNARETCPHFPGQTKMIHHAFADPAAVEGDEETRLEAFRRARDEIKNYLEKDFVKVIRKK